MPVKRRTPKDRDPRVSERAIRLFMKLQRVAWESDPWWDLYSDLHDEIGAHPSQWPCIERRGNPYPSGTDNHADWEPDAEAQALHRTLVLAARELRSAERRAKQPH